MALTRGQKHVVSAGFIAWALDAFDFFVLVFVLKDVTNTFHVGLKAVAVAITITLMMRPIGALFFGVLADRYGRKPVLIANIALYSLIELLTCFSPNLTTFLVLRAIYGIAMGGVWGVGAALIMESIPEKVRGFISGLLQAGYPVGFLIASVVFGLLYNYLGWRGMFAVGILPLVLVFYIYYCVAESPSWQARRKMQEANWLKLWLKNWKIVMFAIILMTAFNFFSHGTQDLYPTFLEVQHGFDTHLVSIISIITSLGAIVGSLFMGSLSSRIGKPYAIALAALLSLLIIPLWAFSHSVVLLSLGGFLMQIFVQGAWGVVPAYLTELSPNEISATLPGFTYQLGNFLASGNAVLQVKIAQQYGGNYSYALTIVAALAAVGISILVLWRRKFQANI